MLDILISSFVSSIIYQIYSYKKEEFKTFSSIKPYTEVKDKLTEEISKKNANDKSPNVYIEGIVTPINESEVIQCFNSKKKAVIIKNTIKRHKVKWSNFWNDWIPDVELISINGQSVPFNVSINKKPVVTIPELKLSSIMKLKLPVISDSYIDKNTKSVVKSLIEYVNGERFNGIQNIEKGFIIGSPITIIGRLEYPKKINIINNQLSMPQISQEIKTHDNLNLEKIIRTSSSYLSSALSPVKTLTTKLLSKESYSSLINTIKYYTFSTPKTTTPNTEIHNNTNTPQNGLQHNSVLESSPSSSTSTPKVNSNSNALNDSNPSPTLDNNSEDYLPKLFEPSSSDQDSKYIISSKSFSVLVLEQKKNVNKWKWIFIASSSVVSALILFHIWRHYKRKRQANQNTNEEENDLHSRYPLLPRGNENISSTDSSSLRHSSEFGLLQQFINFVFGGEISDPTNDPREIDYIDSAFLDYYERQRQELLNTQELEAQAARETLEEEIRRRQNERNSRSSSTALLNDSNIQQQQQQQQNPITQLNINNPIPTNTSTEPIPTHSDNVNNIASSQLQNNNEQQHIHHDLDHSNDHDNNADNLSTSSQSKNNTQGLTIDNRLESQQQLTPQDDSLNEYCVVCFSEKRNYVFLPCRHLCVCQNCVFQLNRCPLCRSNILSCIKVFT